MLHIPVLLLNILSFISHVWLRRESRVWQPVSTTFMEQRGTFVCRRTSRLALTDVFVLISVNNSYIELLAVKVAIV